MPGGVPRAGDTRSDAECDGERQHRDAGDVAQDLHSVPPRPREGSAPQTPMVVPERDSKSRVTAASTRAKNLGVRKTRKPSPASLDGPISPPLSWIPAWRNACGSKWT